MLYIKSSGLTHFITESLYLLTTFTHFAHPPCLLGMILEVQGGEWHFRTSGVLHSGELRGCIEY